MSEQKLTDFVSLLPEIVARALHVKENPDAHLTANDIEVWVQESGRLDVNAKDIQIIIWANEHPERLADLEQRKDFIVQYVRDSFYSKILTGYVWVLLQPAAFGEL
jgi:hypothetical protein